MIVTDKELATRFPTPEQAQRMADYYEMRQPQRLYIVEREEITVRVAGRTPPFRRIGYLRVAPPCERCGDPGTYLPDGIALCAPCIARLTEKCDPV